MRRHLVFNVSTKKINHLTYSIFMDAFKGAKSLFRNELPLSCESKILLNDMDNCQ